MNEELNKKLAEWCGFEYVTTEKVWKPDIDCDYGSKQHWVYLDGEESFFLPDFTTSLDDCFEYIVPKLDSYMLKENIWGVEHHCHVIMKGKSATASEETPAVALCRAVEKLIDEL